MTAIIAAVLGVILSPLFLLYAVVVTTQAVILTFLTGIDRALGALRSHLDSLWERISNALSRIDARVGESLASVVNAVNNMSSALQGRQLALETMIPAEAATVTQQVLSQGILTRIAVENSTTQINQMVAAETATIQGDIRGAEEALAPSLGGIGTAITAGFAGMAAVIPAVGALTSAISGTAAQNHQGRIACMASTADRLGQMLLSSALPVALGIGYKLSPAFRGLVNEAGSWVWDMMLKPLFEEAPITPEKAPSLGITMFMNSMLAGVGAHMISMTAEAWAPAKHMGVGYLSAFLADMGSFTRIAQATIGVATSIAVGRPFSYNVLKATRPTLPESRDLENLRAKKEITAAKYKETMQYHGYTDEWIDTWERYLWRDPRLFEIVRLSEIVRPPAEPPPEAAEWLKMADLAEGIGPDWWFWMKFGKAAYDYVDIPILVRAVKWLTMRREQTFYLTQIREGYRDGYLTESRVRELLAHAGLAPDVIDFRMEGMDLEYYIDHRKELVAFLTDNYRKDVIGYDEYLGGLQEVGMVEEKAQLKAERELTRKMPKGG